MNTHGSKTSCVWYMLAPKFSWNLEILFLPQKITLYQEFFLFIFLILQRNVPRESQPNVLFLLQHDPTELELSLWPPSSSSRSLPPWLGTWREPTSTSLPLPWKDCCWSWGFPSSAPLTVAAELARVAASSSAVHRNPSSSFSSSLYYLLSFFFLVFLFCFRFLFLSFFLFCFCFEMMGCALFLPLFQVLINMTGVKVSKVSASLASFMNQKQTWNK